MTFPKAWTLVFLSLFLSTCSSSVPILPDREDLTVSKVENTDAFQLKTAGHFIMNDSAEYAAFTAKYWKGETPPPSIDFNQDTLIAVFYGAHFSGCQTQVEVIRRVTWGFGFFITEVDPLPDLGTCTTPVMPHQFVTVPKRSGFGSFIGDAPSIESKVISFENLPDAEKFFVAESGIQLFRDEAAWLQLWEASWTESDANGRTPPPEVDFSQNMVLAVFYGQGFSGCDQGVEVIGSVEETCPIVCSSNQLVVRLNPLPEDLGSCREALAPLQMIVLPQSDLELIPSGPVPN